LEISWGGNYYDVSYSKIIFRSWKNVIIDGILVEQPELKPHYEQMKTILKDNPLEIVEVYCPLEICRKRNLERGNRYEQQSDEQYEIMAADIKYSCRVDTHKQTSEECAESIIQTLFR
jgi:chloramphenicol 3-O phosphotransferase